MNFKVNIPKGPAGGAASGLLKLGVIGGLCLYGAANSLYNVEGGHRAIVFNRVVGVKEKVIVCALKKFLKRFLFFIFFLFSFNGSNMIRVYFYVFHSWDLCLLLACAGLS